MNEHTRDAYRAAFEIPFGGPTYPTPADLLAGLPANEAFHDPHGAGVPVSPRDRFERAYLAQLDHARDTGDLVPVGEIIGYYQAEMRRYRGLAVGAGAEHVIRLGGEQHPTPADLRAGLPDELRDDFEQEYLAALAEARVNGNLVPLAEMLPEWGVTMRNRANPRWSRIVDDVARIQAGLPVETVPVIPPERQE